MSGNVNVQLYHSDFRRLTEQQIPSKSVDLIFTDAPNDLSMYQDLAKFGNKCLKEGCIVGYLRRSLGATYSI
ncbi:MAG: hypothetical protein WA667_19460 [Candidatus Nitrosopolaris sp.]